MERMAIHSKSRAASMHLWLWRLLISERERIHVGRMHGGWPLAPQGSPAKYGGRELPVRCRSSFSLCW